MQIQSTKLNYYNYKEPTNFRKREETPKYKIDKSSAIAGAALGTTLLLSAALLSRNNLEKNIAKKGLEIKDKILYNKANGEKFTGKIKSNVGLLGFNKTETSVFVDGKLTEKMYRGLFGQEITGLFFKDDKFIGRVDIGYPYFLPFTKAVSLYRFDKTGCAMKKTDHRGFSGESVFKWAREKIEKLGFYEG